MSRPKISLARAALFYSSRQKVFSRRATSPLPQGLDLLAGEGAGAVGVLSPSVQVGGGVSAQPASLRPPRHRRTQRGELAVPSRRGGVLVTASEASRHRPWPQLPEGGPGTNAQRESGEGGAVDPRVVGARSASSRNASLAVGEEPRRRLTVSGRPNPVTAANSDFAATKQGRHFARRSPWPDGRAGSTGARPPLLGPTG
jgi:hypothetical protein